MQVTSKQGDEFLDRQSSLLDNAEECASRERFVAMNRNAHTAHRRTIMAHYVVTAADTVQLETRSSECSNGFAPGNCRQGSASHAQAAIVR